MPSRDDSHPSEFEHSSISHMWVVDQVSDLSVSVEVDGERLEQIPRWLFPDSVREGMVFRVHQEVGGTRSVLTIEVDVDERERRMERSRRQIEEAKKKSRRQGGGTGDITL